MEWTKSTAVRTAQVSQTLNPMQLNTAAIVTVAGCCFSPENPQSPENDYAQYCTENHNLIHWKYKMRAWYEYSKHRKSQTQCSFCISMVAFLQKGSLELKYTSWQAVSLDGGNEIILALLAEIHSTVDGWNSAKGKLVMHV